MAGRCENHMAESRGEGEGVIEDQVQSLTSSRFYFLDILSSLQHNVQQKPVAMLVMPFCHFTDIYLPSKSCMGLGYIT